MLEVTDRRVAVTGEYQGHRRMTLTYPALAAARQILWLVTGPDKADALGRLLDGDRSIPAGRVENAAMTVVADEAAAGHAPGLAGFLRHRRFELFQALQAGVLGTDHPGQPPSTSGHPVVSCDQHLLDVEPVLAPVEHRLADGQVLGPEDWHG